MLKDRGCAFNPRLSAIGCCSLGVLVFCKNCIALDFASKLALLKILVELVEVDLINAFPRE